MIIYKLTDRAGYTRRGEPGATMWEVGRRYGAHEGDDLSFERGFYDVYTDPLVGLFLNPIHANVKNPQLWEGETPEIIIDQRGVKAVVRELVLVRELQAPEIAPEQRIRFAIFCAASVIPNRNRIWHGWARDWLSGADRMEEAAGWAAGRASWAACAALIKAEAETEAARWAAWTPWAALMKADTETQAAEARWAAWEAGWAAAGAAWMDAWEARWAAEKARRATEKAKTQAEAVEAAAEPWEPEGGWAAVAAAVAAWVPICIAAAKPLDLPALARRAMDLGDLGTDLLGAAPASLR